jgi:serine phosphatase RsbU (regulator of sigma subunit)
MKDKHGPAIGAFEGVGYQQRTIQMKPGDSIIVYTDGVTEAIGQNGEWYTVDRLKKILGTKSSSPETIVSAVAEDVKQFKGTAPQADDITMICLQYNG